MIEFILSLIRTTELRVVHVIGLHHWGFSLAAADFSTDAADFSTDAAAAASQVVGPRSLSSRFSICVFLFLFSDSRSWTRACLLFTTWYVVELTPLRCEMCFPFFQQWNTYFFLQLVIMKPQ